MAAGDVNNDHHLSVDAAGSSQPLNSGSHLMRKVLPHEALEIQKNEPDVHDLLEVEDLEETLIPTLYKKYVDRKRSQGNIDLMPQGSTAQSEGPSGTWRSASCFRYKTLAQCKKKCTANDNCKGFVDNKGHNPKTCTFKGYTTGTAVNAPTGKKDFYGKITATYPYSYTKKSNKKVTGSALTTIQSSIDPEATAMASTGGSPSNIVGRQGRWRFNSDGATVASFYYNKVNDCKKLCSDCAAKSGCACAGFVVVKSPSNELPYCAFKTSLDNKKTATNFDVYERNSR